ncbi:hypothetical protein GC101_17215 [Paenibacillus sp. LMG 31459]|uniref:Rubredoxin-like domain-containing protein n=1 Tax=Paenibacillus phytohabitans TaxID=2654978 RepID=A0ABX1YID2_9BACL|nr:hypothetical protein [Paenibacillus phytohabitans]NOU80606.1 hypothetical protein [Paenibacillus phytohabitans]
MSKKEYSGRKFNPKIFLEQIVKEGNAESVALPKDPKEAKKVLNDIMINYPMKYHMCIGCGRTYAPNEKCPGCGQKEVEVMKWILVNSLPYTHEFELDGDDTVQLKLSCRESDIMHKLRLTFGSDAEADLSMLEPE